MSQLVFHDLPQHLGIDIHISREAKFSRGFLTGTIIHDNTTRAFTLCVTPNYQLMAEISAPKAGTLLCHEFDSARSQDISLGAYPSLDVVDYALTEIERWYRKVLKQNGANQRFLVEEGNSLHLVENTSASDIRYGDAIIRAHSVQAFAMMNQNHPMDYKTVVGKIMPVFLQALGLKEYHLMHDTSKDGNGEVKFIIDKVGAFAFYKPQTEGGPAFMERYSYVHGNYQRTFAGETKGDVLKKFAFEWLADVAREMQILTRGDFENHLDELARDVHQTWVSIDKRAAQNPPIFEEPPHVRISTNVVPFGARGYS